MNAGKVIVFALKVLFLVIIVAAIIYQNCKSDQPEEA